MESLLLPVICFTIIDEDNEEIHQAENSESLVESLALLRKLRESEDRGWFIVAELAY